LDRGGSAIGHESHDGALRVPTWPVRIIIVAMSLLSALSYVSLFVRGLRGEHEAAPDTGTSQGSGAHL
jgi:hypothetical protein